MFRQLMLAACLVAPVAVAAQDKGTSQQSKMATCNKEAGAKNLKGDERKKFMSDCLSADKTTSQQDKMKACNKQAGDQKLAGDARKKFMSECLSG
jgi:hypothetical protein